MDASAIQAIDDSVQPGCGSQFVSANLTREGKCHRISDLAEREELDAMISHVERQMVALADRLIDGEVSIAPYRINRQTPCSYCPYGSICRFDIETQYPRALDGMKMRDAMQRMVEENR
jgi:ATP-dependent helicase/nuclease subunit B